MAAPTITLDTPRAARLGNTQFGIISGGMVMSSYDTAHPAVTAIAGQFKSGSQMRVMPDGVTTSGYALSWDNATSSFKAYTTASGGGALAEVASATVVGSAGFIAIGHLGL